MSTYLLLRDNKESGPYSFEELRNKGLKAYDLVWIDGKSAAWRYPSEVEELRSFAPAVEEQPFDRFFKRAAQTNSPVPAEENNSTVTAQSRAVPEKEIGFSSGKNGSMLSGEPSSVPGKRIIYVTLPSDKGSQGMRVPSLREPARIQTSAAQASAPALERLPLIEKEPARTELSPRYAKPSVPPEEKFSQNPEDMWRAAVEITPRQNGLDPKRILQPVAAIVCILALLAAGIFIGLSIKSDSFGFSPKTVVKEEASSSLPAPVQQDHTLAATPVVQPVTSPTTQEPPTPTANQANNNAANTANGRNTLPSGPGTTVSSAAPTHPAPVPLQNKKSDRTKDRSSLANQKVAAAALLKDSASMNLPAVHREAIHRSDEIGLDKDAMRNSIANMVAVGAGKYSIGTFGGISELQLTVSNHSLYPLDLVVVEIQYIQANKKVFKTENVYFRDLAPGSALMQVVPKSARGIKIQYKVTLINSKELGLSYSGI